MTIHETIDSACKESFVLRLMSGIRISESKCWEWTKCCDSHGYGQIRIRKRTVYTHVLSYALFRTAPENGLCVLHRCDNPLCCNPDHLWLGTRAENNADAIAKGRNCKGENSPHAKLTQLQVDEIRRLHRDHGWKPRRLAAEFGVNPPAIRKIVQGKRWKESYGN